MVINGKEMTDLGNRPFNPVYSSWLDCWASYPRYRMLQATNLFSRPYTGPTSINWDAADDESIIQPVEGFQYIGPTKFPEQGYSVPSILQKYYAAFRSPVEPKVSHAKFQRPNHLSIVRSSSNW